MKHFLNRVFNTEFLPMSEVRKIKITIVMVFLLFLTAVTIPFSIFLDYSTVFKIIAISTMSLMFLLMVFLIKWNKLLVAIHLTIVYSILLTLFYTLGSTNLYAYLFFYITLVIIIFYQEIYVYVLYGFLVVLFGSFYTFVNQDGLSLPNDIFGSTYLFLLFLILFFIIFLIQILLNEKFYTELNYEWVRMNHVLDKYQDHILFYLNTIRKTMKESPFYEDLDFQKAADELAVFIYEQFAENGKEITNVLDLYIYIHERGLDKILSNDEFSVSTKKIANRLSKYMLDQRTEMFSMIVNFHTKFKATAEYKDNRYLYNIESFSDNSDERIIALALVYMFLSNEVYGLDEWDEMKQKMTKDEVLAVFSSDEAESFFSSAEIGFLKDNMELFEAFLGNQSQ